jgi:glycosyltransferase involved in cell wall biosynthesis
VIPTAVDLRRYAVSANRRKARAKIVWIGSPSTTRYLELLREPLATLTGEVPFTLRVIGGGPVDMPGVEIELLPWSQETEAAAIGDCDIGIMPLQDSPWERGKCAYKLIQYMACGLPTVASPVGANVDVVIEGETGYLAHDAAEWINHLKRLLLDSDLRRRMGACGRVRVEQHYCIQRTAPRLIDLLSDVVRTSR